MGRAEFKRHGWQVEAVYLGNPMRHDEKYPLINQGFAGKQRLMPFFNRTDGSDAFDTLYIGCEKFPQAHLGTTLNVSGIS